MTNWPKKPETWDEAFAAIDKVVKDMPPVDRACSTCGLVEIPPLPENPEMGWIAKCNASIPANILGFFSDVQMTFSAADAARWESKRQRQCPCWIEKPF